MFDWLQAFAEDLTRLLAEGNLSVYITLFAVSMVIEFAIPVPFVQDTVLLYVGYGGVSNLWPTAPLVMASLLGGRLVAATIVFWLARRFGPRLMVRLGKRYHRLVQRAESLGDSLGKRSILAVTAARLTPGLLTASTIAAGLFKVRYSHFCLGVAISSIIPDVGEIASGLAIRAGITVAGIHPSPALFIMSLLSFMSLVWLVRWLVARRKKTSTWLQH